ncbi:MAG: ATP-binding cassette domain-containing protein [Litorimonas sp.]
MLRATGITVRYGTNIVLDHVDAAVPPGRITAILGPNGAGKSTLLKVLSGDLTPDAGSVTLGNRPLSGLSPAQLAARRAVLPQHTRPAFGFKAWEIVRLGRSPFGDTQAAALAHVEDALSRVDAAHLAERDVDTLSGGERQRIFLAKALCQAQGCGRGCGSGGARGRPGLLLLDEPTAALDMKQTAGLMHSLRAAAEEGIGVALIAHDVSTMRRHADRLLLVGGGAVRTCDVPARLDRAAIAALYGMEERDVAA